MIALLSRCLPQLSRRPPEQYCPDARPSHPSLTPTLATPSGRRPVLRLVASVGEDDGLFRIVGVLPLGRRLVITRVIKRSVGGPCHEIPSPRFMGVSRDTVRGRELGWEAVEGEPHRLLY